MSEEMYNINVRSEYTSSIMRSAQVHIIGILTNIKTYKNLLVVDLVIYFPKAVRSLKYNTDLCIYNALLGSKYREDDGWVKRWCNGAVFSVPS